MTDMVKPVQEFGAPVLALCGFSGSGKTTLIEAVIPKLVARGLSVAVVKHDSHGFVVDKEGKDSDRFFRAGATVALRGPNEQFQRRSATAKLPLEVTLADFALDHDLLIVEGHKDTPLPKLWVGNAETNIPPDHVTSVQQVLPWDSDRVTALLAFMDEWLPKAWVSRPLFGGLLVGGHSSRMGRPKQLVEFEGSTLGEIGARALSGAIGDVSPITLNSKVVVLGAGQVPASLQDCLRLSDAPGLAGPIAGLLAAHRWAPRAAWLLTACDHPWLSASDFEALMAQRRPGVWAIFPRQEDDQHPCPTLALYEPQALTVLERSLLVNGSDRARLAELFHHPRALIVKSTCGVVNVNTPQELSVQEARAKNAEISNNAKRSVVIKNKD